jgi:hypothetical protein
VQHGLLFAEAESVWCCWQGYAAVCWPLAWPIHRHRSHDFYPHSSFQHNPLPANTRNPHHLHACRPLRNAPKCSNRKFWSELKLIDARTASTPSDMFGACLQLLEDAGMSCATTSNIVVFRAQSPGKGDGPRVWNNQLIRYAGPAFAECQVCIKEASAHALYSLTVSHRQPSKLHQP